MQIESLGQYHYIVRQNNRSMLLCYGMVVAELNNGKVRITKVGKKQIKYRDIKKAIAKYKDLNKEVK